MDRLDAPIEEDRRKISENERLDGWKAIAAYLDRPVRTVQRWKKQKGLPVHHRGALRVVFAYKPDLDSWLRAKPIEKQEESRATREAGIADNEPGSEAPIRSNKRQIGKLLSIGSAGAVLIAAILAYQFTRPLPAPRGIVYRQLTDDAREKGGRLVTDGPRIYFSESTAEGRVAAWVSIHGGAVTRMPAPLHDVIIMDISPDRSQLLVGAPALGAARALWMLPLSGGAPRRLGDLVAHSASWSPDGRLLAYANDQSLYLASADGTETRKVVTVAGFILNPRWRPDGSRVYFDLTDSNASSSIWEVETTGKNRRPALPAWSDPHREDCGFWTGDAKYFFFVSSRNGRGDIWVLNQRASLLRRGLSKPAPVRLTTGPLSFTNLVLGPNDRTLFAVGSQERAGAELVRYDSRVAEFVPYLRGIPALWVNFSRDGRWVAYVKFRENTLWRMRPDGSEAKQLTFPPISVDGPDWSPDGTQIAFRAKKPGKPYKIYVISAKGGKLQELLPQHREDEGIPTWSPDGNQMVFGDVPVLYGHATGNEVIHVYDLRTHHLSNLPDSKGLWTSRWSPNGRYIAALAIAKQELRLFDFQSGRWRDLGVDHVTNGMTWSHHGDYIYFDGPGAGSGILRVRALGGKIEQVASLNSLTRAAAWWSGLTLDDSPMVLREIGTNEIYALDVEWP